MVEPPGPIPNPEVKRRSANGSGTIGPVRVGRRQVYAQHFENIQSAGLFFVGGAGNAWATETLQALPLQMDELRVFDGD